ncbi:MAG: hypothetical protein FWD01_00085 [Defluviitaleaceae bacterium]|nr:hypothetical protein [Defluviitaleaceae bacterium]
MRSWHSEHGSNFLIGLIVMIWAIYVLNNANHFAMGFFGVIFGGISAFMTVMIMEKSRVRFPFRDGFFGTMFLIMSLVIIDICIKIMGGGIISRIYALAVVIMLLIDFMNKKNLHNLKIPRALVITIMSVFIMGNLLLILSVNIPIITQITGFVSDFWNGIREGFFDSLYGFAESDFLIWLFGIWDIVRNFLGDTFVAARESASSLFASAPLILQIMIIFAWMSAAVGIIYSHIAPIISFCNNWQKYPGKHLMYSYFVKTGNLMAKLSYAMSHKILRDNTLFFTISGATYRLGDMKHESKTVVFLMSIPYIPLLVISHMELIMRVAIGTVYLLAAKSAHTLLLFVARHISDALVPFAAKIDTYLRVGQHCPRCFADFDLPNFRCPECDKIHEGLTPGRCGVLFAKCSCNQKRKFLPTTIFTGRSRLECVCPICGEDLASANSKQFFIHLIGGSNAGKTAYMAIFANNYLKEAKNKREDYSIFTKVRPKKNFINLAEILEKGETETEPQLKEYNFVHSHKKPNNAAKDSLIIFDINGDQILNEYTKNPINFGFCDGFMFFVDPLSVKAVRDKMQSNFDELGMISREKQGDIKHSPDDFDNVVNQFILKFNSITGESSEQISNIPVAVVITKVDIDVIREGISNCGNLKEYLQDIELDSTIGNIDAKFSNIAYFAVSSKKSFGISEPIAWIMQKSGNSAEKILEKPINKAQKEGV